MPPLQMQMIDAGINECCLGETFLTNVDTYSSRGPGVALMKVITMKDLLAICDWQ